MSFIKAKKYLGQHFLIDQNIAKKIVDSLSNEVPCVLEIGPGTGVLTQYLINRPEINLHVIEIDNESVSYLQENYPQLKNIWSEDFLKFNKLNELDSNFSIIGNFPYNISSQIFFKVLEMRDQVSELVGMIQKEVAERIAGGHGKKTYGILSVLLQTYYNIEYLFTVSEHVFDPPPKVKSAVIRLRRNDRLNLPCDEKFFVKVVKAAFHLRRKMLRNSLKSICENLPAEYAEKRPEQLSVEDFIKLASAIENLEKK